MTMSIFMARKMRYQGAGSSHIVPNLLDCPYDELIRHGVSFDYAPGYDLNCEEPDETLIREACAAAKGKDIVYLFAGLPDAYESEGFDREDLFMNWKRSSMQKEPTRRRKDFKA